MNAVELTTGPIFPGIPCEPCFPFLPCKKIDYNSINLKLHIFNFLENVHSELLTFLYFLRNILQKITDSSKSD